MDTLLTLSQAANILEVSQDTLREWSDRGYIESEKTDGGHRRFYKSVVDSFFSYKGQSEYLKRIFHSKDQFRNMLYEKRYKSIVEHILNVHKNSIPYFEKPYIEKETDYTVVSEPGEFYLFSPSYFVKCGLLSGFKDEIVPYRTLSRLIWETEPRSDVNRTPRKATLIVGDLAFTADELNDWWNLNQLEKIYSHLLTKM